jgi:hypothetical protein
MLNIEKKIVKDSHYTRQLQTIKQLEKLVDQVKYFKAWKKFSDLINEPHPDREKSKYHPQDKSRGEWRMWVGGPKYTWDKNAGYLHFQPFNDIQKDYAVEIELPEKSIPGLIEAIRDYKEKRLQWIKEENEMSIYTGKIERDISESLSCEYTQTQFDKKKQLYIEYLKNLAKYLEETK